jgi:hypothetical protein
MKEGDKVKIIKYNKGRYLGKIGTVTGSGGVMWGRARKLSPAKQLIKGAEARQMWWVRLNHVEGTILCLEEHLELIQ